MAPIWGGIITLALSVFIYLVWGMMNGFTSPFPIDPVLLVGMAVLWVSMSIIWLFPDSELGGGP